jgi:hypothetical protein
LILQENDFGRLLIIYVTQLLFSGIFLFLAYKILKRNKNRLTLLLSSFYISVGSAFILNAIYPPLRVNPIVYILFNIIIFFSLFGPIFLIIFLINLLKTDEDFSLKKQLTIICLYAVSLFLILNFPGGITINEDTNWRPVYSWSFLIVLYIFMTCIIAMPFFFLFLKLYNGFEDDNLKKKLMYFFIGFCGVAFVTYGAVLYNTWDDPIFKAIWIYLSFIVVLSGYLIYYGMGRGL